MDIVSRKRYYEYLIRTHGERFSDSVPPRCTTATIGHFDEPGRGPLPVAEAAWMAEAMQRLFVPQAETVSVFLPLPREGKGNPGAREKLARSLRGIACATAELASEDVQPWESPVVAYRLASGALGAELLQRLYNDGQFTCLLFGPPSGPDLRTSLRTLRALWRAQDVWSFIHYAHSRSSLSKLDEYANRWLHRLGLGAHQFRPMRVPEHLQDHERPRDVAWRLIMDRVGVVGHACQLDHDSVAWRGIEIAINGVQPDDVDAVIHQAAKRHGITAIRARGLGGPGSLHSWRD